MQLLPQIAEKHLADWNRRVYTDSDFYNICEQKSIVVKETELIEAAGEYLVYRNYHFILLHSFCIDEFKLWVKYHELSHYFLHAPGKFSQTVKRKMDFEANVIAAVALVPFCLLERYSYQEINEYYDYPFDLILLRWQIFRRYGI